MMHTAQELTDMQRETLTALRYRPGMYLGLRCTTNI